MTEWDSNDQYDRLLVLGWRDTPYAADEVPESVWEELADPGVTKVAFTKSDHRWMRLHGREIAGPFHDVQTMAWVLDERQELGLDDVSRRYGVDPKEKRIVRADGKVWFRCDDGSLVLIGDAPIGELKEYNRLDLEVESQLYSRLWALLSREGLLRHWRERVVPYSAVLARMEAVGLPLNVFKTKVLGDQLLSDILDRGAALLADGGLPEDFNLGSNDQLMNFLFRGEFEWGTRYELGKEDMARARAGEWPDALPRGFEPTKLGRIYVHGYHTLKGLGLRPVDKTPKCADGKCGHPDEADHLPSVSAKTLKVNHGSHPWVADLVEYKLRSKVLQFLSVWGQVHRGGRLYTHFNQTGTKTGRLSSSDPVNLQNVPSRGEFGKLVRSLFQAPKGYVFVHGDFGQIEPRLMAHFSQDPEMLRVFERGLDLYEEATVAVLGDRYPKGTPERQLVRTNVLGMGYGARPKKVRRQLAEEGFYIPIEKVRKTWRAIRELYHVFFEWKDRWVELCEAQGYAETIGGHRRRISWVDPHMRWKAENQAVNSTIQGSAADIAAGMMVEVDRLLPHLEPCAAVHDEGLWLVDELAAAAPDNGILEIVRWAGEEGHGFRLDNVAIVFEPSIIRNWGEKG